MLNLGLLLLFQAFFQSAPDETNPTAGYAALAAFAVVYIVIFVVVLAILIFLHWRVAVKCGYPGAYSLLTFIPLVNIIIYLIWIFSEWPIETELKRLRTQLGLPPNAPIGYIAPASGGTAISNP